MRALRRHCYLYVDVYMRARTTLYRRVLIYYRLRCLVRLTSCGWGPPQERLDATDAPAFVDVMCTQGSSALRGHLKGLLFSSPQGKIELVLHPPQLHMCPHTTSYVSAYDYMCPCATIRMSSCHYMCPHTTICALGLLYMCAHRCWGLQRADVC